MEILQHPSQTKPAAAKVVGGLKPSYPPSEAWSACNNTDRFWLCQLCNHLMKLILLAGRQYGPANRIGQGIRQSLPFCHWPALWGGRNTWVLHLLPVYMDEQSKMLRELQTWRVLNKNAWQIQPVHKYTKQSIHLCLGPSELLDVTDNNQDKVILTIRYSCNNLKMFKPTYILPTYIHVYVISTFMPIYYYAHEINYFHFTTTNIPPKKNPVWKRSLNAYLCSYLCHSKN